MKKQLALILALALVLTALAGCTVTTGGGTTDNSTLGSPAPGDGADASNTPRGELSVYPAYIQMPTSLLVYPDVETGQEVDWSSSDTSVATVGPDGMITGVAEGEAVITATVKGKPSVTASCGVRVVLSAADIAALMAEAAAKGTDGTDVTPKPDVADEGDTDIVLIWEDEPPEELPEGWDEDTTDDSAVTPTRAGASVPHAEFIPAAGTQQSGAVSLAGGGNGKHPNYPTGLKPQDGSKTVKPNRNETKNLMDKGFIWSLYISGIATSVAYDYYGVAYPLDTHLRFGRAIKVGGDTPLGEFEEIACATLCVFVDTSNYFTSPRYKPDQCPIKYIFYYEGRLDHFNFTFNKYNIIPWGANWAYTDRGKFTWHFIATDLQYFEDGSVFNYGGECDWKIDYVIKVCDVTGQATLTIDNPLGGVFVSVDKRELKFSGHLYKEPIVYDADAPLK